MCAELHAPTLTFVSLDVGRQAGINLTGSMMALKGQVMLGLKLTCSSPACQVAEETSLKLHFIDGQKKTFRTDERKS